MRIIVSPHLDDAVFSVGEHLANAQPTSIVCPFAGIPTDPAGAYKYRTLHAEHDRACSLLGVRRVNGPWLDDVYPERDLTGLERWLSIRTRTASEVWIPLGVHHPDHLMISDLMANLSRRALVVYEEAPYRVLYPELAQDRLAKLGAGRVLEARGQHPALDVKRAAVGCYASQLRSDVVERCVYVPERTWTCR
jgi:LmbE family N-acetylglucosaminyl deacetylase